MSGVNSMFYVWLIIISALILGLFDLKDSKTDRFQLIKNIIKIICMVIIVTSIIIMEKC